MITINRNEAQVELTVAEALSLIEQLAAGIAHSTRFGASRAGVLPMPIDIGDKLAYPGILSLTVVTSR